MVLGQASLACRFYQALPSPGVAGQPGTAQQVMSHTPNTSDSCPVWKSLLRQLIWHWLILIEKTGCSEFTTFFSPWAFREHKHNFIFNPVFKMKQSALTVGHCCFYCCSRTAAFHFCQKAPDVRRLATDENKCSLPVSGDGSVRLLLCYKLKSTIKHQCVNTVPG